MKYINLLIKEIKDLFLSKVSLLFIIILNLFYGYSFFMAIKLYSNASIDALNNPLYATGFEPVQGVFLPSFGSFFILFSLLLPFVIIPIIADEKQNNTFIILISKGFDFKNIIITKFISSVVFLIFLFLFILPSIIIWVHSGGHIPYKEFFLLVTGYFLYGILVISISMFSAVIAQTKSSASILTLSIIILSWIIDFNFGLGFMEKLKIFSNLTFTTALKYFEDGILSIKYVVYFIFISFVFLYLSYLFINFEIKNKIYKIIITLLFVIIGIFLIMSIPYNYDFTESHRNSFSNDIILKLKKIKKLQINIYMSPQDSRYKDFKNNFLKKLLLVKNDVKVKIIKGKELKEKYGLFVYEVDNKKGETYSNSEEEIFPLIFKLAGIKDIKIKKEKINNFKGYPLVINKKEEYIVRIIYFIFNNLSIIIIYILILLYLKRRAYNEKI